jgi:hypothetical protein
MDERFLGYTKGTGSHSRKCTNSSCDNKIKNSSKLDFCQSCSEKWKYDKIYNLEHDIARKKEKIYKLEDAIAREKEKLRELEEALHIEKIQFKYQVDLVSDDRRVHQGFSKHGLPMKLETHCTIVRVEDSPENVYFGHVTLVISDDFGTKYKWHYGTEVYKKKIPKAKDLKHVFWYYDNKDFPPETTNVNYFANFSTIPDNTTLEEIMKYHFKKCVTFFKKERQWPNQVWYPTDKIKINSESEIATDLVDRLIQMKEERKTIKYDEFTKANLARIKSERKAAKEEKRLQKQEKQEQAKMAVELAIQQEQARKADQPTQATEYISEDIRQKAEEDEIKKREAEAEENEKNRREELSRIQKIAAEKLAEQQKKKREEKLALEIQQKNNDALAAKKAIEQETKRKALEAKKIADLALKHANDKALEEAHKEALAQKKEIVQPSTSILPDKGKRGSRLEMQVKNKVKEFLEDIKEKQKDINMENQLQKEEEKDPMSDNSFNLRSKLYERYILLLKHIKDTMNDLENEINKYLKESDKTKFLQTIRDRKENLQTLSAVIFKKYTFYMIQEWENYYIENILPLEKQLVTFKESDHDDASEVSEVRSCLIRYYRDEYTNKSLEWDRLELEILSEEDSGIIRDKIRDLNAKVDAKTRSKILSELEAEYLNLFYKDRDDNFNEPDEIIIENLRILNPTDDVAERIIQKAKKAKKGKQFFSTKTILLMYPKLFE